MNKILRQIIGVLVFIVMSASLSDAGVLLTYPKFRATNDSGTALVGGELYTYIAGTSTNKATYSDYNLATANANPVVLDRRGEAMVYGAGAYKFVLKDSAGNTVWSVDNLTLATEQGDYAFYPNPGEADQNAVSTSGSITDILTALGTSKKATVILYHNGAANTTTYTVASNADWSAYTNVTFKIVPGAVISHGAFTVNIPNANWGRYQVFIGTGAVTLSGIWDAAFPEWWGAKGDGTTDSTAALNYAALASQKVSLAIGTYMTDGLVVNGSGNVWSGASGNDNINIGPLLATKIKARGTQNYVLSTISRHTVFENIIFDGNWTTTKVVKIGIPSLGIRFKNCTFMATLDDTGLNGASGGTLVYIDGITQGDNMVFEDSIFTSGDPAKLSAESLTVYGSNTFLNNINRCLFYYARIHISFFAGGGRITNSEFENFTLAAIYYTGSSQRLLIENCYSEEVVGSFLRMTVQSAIITAPIILRNNQTTVGLLLYLGQPITLENNHISGAVQLEPPGALTPYFRVLSIRNGLGTGFTGTNASRVIHFDDDFDTGIPAQEIPFALGTGAGGSVGSFNLTINSATTVVSGVNIRTGSYVFLSPVNAESAVDVGSATGVWVSAISAGTSFTVTHPNRATVDRTFYYMIVN